MVIAAKTAEPHPKLPGTIYTAAKESMYNYFRIDVFLPIFSLQLQFQVLLEVAFFSSSLSSRRAVNVKWTSYLGPSDENNAERYVDIKFVVKYVVLTSNFDVNQTFYLRRYCFERPKDI